MIRRIAGSVLLLLALAVAGIPASAETLTGRVVGRVLVKQLGGNFTEMDVNRELVARGLAVVYRQYGQDDELVAVEAEAQRERRGVWAGECAKWSCGQMASCDEARDYLTRCGVLRLDGDKDGVPCEGLCR